MAIANHVINAFHELWYFSRESTITWLGVPVIQNPFDLWVMQEIIWETKPDLIIETGTAFGGSALFYASCFDGKVISIDMGSDVGEPTYRQERIAFWHGDCVSEELLTRLRHEAIKHERVMVVLDSDHSTEHVAKELEAYHELVSPGCYLIVCDTNIGGNPVDHPTVPGPGPKLAVEQFLKTHTEFVADKSREKFLMTFFPGGWLRKADDPPHV